MDKQNIKQIESYAQLAKHILSINMLDTQAISDLLEGLNFVEDIDLIYNNQDLGVLYKQLPIVANGEVLVKVVLLMQAGNFILVIPQKITETYNLLLEEPELIEDKNSDISLYAEVYGFNAKDPELEALIKRAYLEAAERLPAYELTSDLEREAEEAEAEEESAASSGTDIPDFSEDLGDFDDIEAQLDNVALEDDPDLSINMEAYKAFKRSTDALPNLIAKLSKQPTVVKENIKLRYLHNVLLIKLENKTIYESLGAHPAIAKKVISNAGELLRTNEDTQLVDSFTIKGNRFFVVAEAVNNFWYTEADELTNIRKKDKVIKPLNENIIKVGKTSIRKENRKYKIAELDGQLVFI